MRTKICIVAMMVSACMWARGEGKEATVAQFTLSSPSFRNNQPMPAKHSCEGEDASPSLKWEGAPSGTKSFALIVDDPDAPGGSWVHWVIYNMPAATAGFPENIKQVDLVAAVWPNGLKLSGWKVGEGGLTPETLADLPGAKQGMNSFGKVGYGGPCPPRGHGVHHYHFRLYALDTDLNLAPRVTRKQLESAMNGHILAQAELVGTYQRE
jgi:Raf kinase inhibitor-like YbhB/YbcL family protein